jgi:glycine/D-amino acid oxidase-like deaminating enzyme
VRPAIVIIGGGISGLTAGIALARRGLEPVIYEQAPELKEVGAGVTLWANGGTPPSPPWSRARWPAPASGTGGSAAPPRDAMITALPLPVLLRQLDLVIGRP